MPESLGLAREITPDLVRVQVALGIEVAHAGGRERPAVGRGGEERLEHGQARLVAPPGTVDPAAVEPTQQGRDVLAAGPGQRVVDLDIRVCPGYDPAVDLEQRLVAVGQ
jgi:hypothetical protein